MPDTKTSLKVIFSLTGFLRWSIIIVRIGMQAQLGNGALASGKRDTTSSAQTKALFKLERTKPDVFVQLPKWCTRSELVLQETHAMG